MKKILFSLAIILLAVTLTTTVMAEQQGKHKGEKLNVGIDYEGFIGHMDYPSLNLFNLPAYYIGSTMDYTLKIENEKNAKYNHLVVLVTHRYYNGDLLPGYNVDSFSGLPYHNIIYTELEGKESESFELSYWIPYSVNPGADQTDLVIYRGYNLEDDSGGNEWSYGRIIFDNTIGYFCPPAE